jgi:hypothetical protein
MSQTIDRDAGDKSKGPRLQKFRALELLFEALGVRKVTQAYIATECESDVSIHTASACASSSYLEENKNYADTTAFTFASGQVLNTIVSFVDSWIAWGCDPEIRFGFYCPNAVGKERSTERTRALGIEWPQEPVLQKLSEASAANELDELTTNSLAILVKDEYRKQYLGKQLAGNETAINSWSTEQWRAFFSQISWKLGESDDAQLKRAVISLIRESQYYQQQHAGKEELIAAAAVELLDERQGLPRAKDRFVHLSDIELIFLKVSADQTVTLPDPAWKMWKGLPSPTDARNITSKVSNVTTSVPKSHIGRWSRKAASGFNTQLSYGTDKSLLALKYRIYTACADRWGEFVEANKGQTITSSAITIWVHEMATHCHEIIAKLQSDHQYILSNFVFVEEMIWVLIDECYLSFDMEPEL